MLREIFVISVFICILYGIIGGVVIIERSASRQFSIAEGIIESANEND